MSDDSIRLPDSHAHLDMPDFDADRDEVLRRAWDAGVTAVLCPIDLTSERSVAGGLALAAADARVRAAAGVHPHQAQLDAPAHADALRRLAAEGRIVAVGEIGLDFHYDFATPAEQRAAFRRQLALAKELRLPAIVHSRLAGRDVAAAVREEGFDRGGVLHCFTEDWDVAREMLDLGFFISFSGIVTFANAAPLREVAARVPADRILVETDAPYLAPVPHRGKRNEPAYVLATAARVAEARRTAVQELAAAVSANFARAFSL